MITIVKSFSRHSLLLPAAIALSLIALPPTFASAADDAEDSQLAAFLIMVTVIIVIYITPTIIAFVRGHPNRWPISLVNFVFGGTVIGWFGALIWALSAIHRSPTGNHGGESGLNLFVNDPKLVTVVPAKSSDTDTGFDKIAADLMRLKTLKDQGVITADELECLRRDVLAKV